MSRILAIDYGLKRTGIAVTDALQIIASGLTTVATNDLISFLKEYLEKEPVELFLVGEPKQMDNTASESEALIIPFINRLNKLLSYTHSKTVNSAIVILDIIIVNASVIT